MVKHQQAVLRELSDTQGLIARRWQVPDENLHWNPSAPCSKGGPPCTSQWRSLPAHPRACLRGQPEGPHTGTHSLLGSAIWILCGLSVLKTHLPWPMGRRYGRLIDLNHQQAHACGSWQVSYNAAFHTICPICSLGRMLPWPSHDTAPHHAAYHSFLHQRDLNTESYALCGWQVST